MKTAIEKLFLVLFVVCALSACSDDPKADDGNKDDGNKEEQLKEATSADFTMVYGVTQDLLNVADITIFYKSGKDEVKSVKMDNSEWKNTVALNSLPDSIGYMVRFKIKENVDEKAEKYKIGKWHTEYCSFKSGEDVFGNQWGGVAMVKSSVDIPGSNIVRYINERFTETEYSYKVDKNGTVTSTKLDWSNVLQ